MKKRGVSFLEMLSMEMKVCSASQRCWHRVLTTIAEVKMIYCAPAAAGHYRALSMKSSALSIRCITCVAHRNCCCSRLTSRSGSPWQGEGYYVARGLSFKEAAFEELECKLTAEQRQTYDCAAEVHSEYVTTALRKQVCR